MRNPTAALLVIGDEILSGRTRDANINVLALELGRVGIQLGEVRVVRDDREAIVQALDALRAGYDDVFTSGGIGPTHDDITADAVAAAFGVGIGVRDDARALLAESVARRGVELTDGVLRMARIPDGATLIRNRVSSAPGFTVGNVHVMAGVPSIFEAMVQAVVPTLAAGVPVVSRTVTAARGESWFAAGLSALADELDDLSFGSYPGERGGRFEVEIVVRGTDPARVDVGAARVEQLLADLDATA